MKKSLLHQAISLTTFAVLSLSSLPVNATVRLGDLGPLEVKFFAHQYDRETPTERLDRLEKLVYGKIQTGSIEERVSSVAKTVNGAAVADLPGSKTSGPANANPGSGKGGTDKGAQTAPNAFDGSSSDYPRVSELERSLLGRSHPGEPVRQRLSRLETKAFGAPSRVDDLAVRVDKLTTYAGVFGMQPGDDVLPQTAGNLRGATDIYSSNSHSLSTTGMLDRVSALELKAFGATSNQPLGQRIAALEVSSFGSASNSGDDMTSRVNRLWASKQPANNQPSWSGITQTAQAPSPSSAHTSSLPFSPSSQFGQQSNQLASSPYNSPYSYGSATSKHKNKGQHSSHGSFIGKIGKVAVFAGSAAVGAGSLALGSMGSRGYYGMGTGYGAYYPSSSGSLSSFSPTGSLSSGSMFGSPYNSAYAGSFYSH
jgi:hypothetical protein